MLWVKWVKTEPPKWMKHCPALRNNFGYTLEMLWDNYVDTEIPKWMKL